ncbi:periplasmic chaperone for outer membrane proteins Skp [Desulfobotulus alkaliphilus]|uniref:Periplasmic chaperone for outer membrane proteins Skp n=1 Tax=Desulfobotulus alkaliphilus TaxID=622671 RepID=A0A562RGE4_9BACT|nr:OmpH family outer membrane protein [Desulfobotulus alkaliphilus]TWI68159.1 periplasmic chaperone for outer membrane proteins Skp [Desulfobotulus alkaliphilus]
MKKMIRGVQVLLLCLMFAGTAFAADVAKIGVFDFETFLRNSKAGQQAKNQVAEEARKLEAQLEMKKQEIEKMRDSLMREAMVLSDEARSQRERDLQIKAMDLRNMEQRFTRSFNQQQNDIMARIQGQVRELIQEIGEKENYLLILENIGVVYAPDRVDITERLILKHDEKYGKSGS